MAAPPCPVLPPSLDGGRQGGSPGATETSPAGPGGCRPQRRA